MTARPHWEMFFSIDLTGDRGRRNTDDWAIVTTRPTCRCSLPLSNTTKMEGVTGGWLYETWSSCAG